MQNHISTLDLQRGPRQLPKGYKSKMIFPLKSLQFHRCPICLSYMKKTYIVMECLHRFCGDCIQKSLRMGMKECPSCRVHIPSRRSLRPDRTYDTIMESMYGDIQRLEEREEKQIEEYNKKNNMNNSYSQSQRLRKMQKSMQKNKKLNQKNGGKAQESSNKHNVIIGKTRNNDLGTNGRSSSVTATTATTTSGISSVEYHPSYPEYANIHNFKQTTLIEFILRKDPKENIVKRLDRECLKVSHDITIQHLKRFLGKKLRYDVWTDFHITVSAGGRQVVIDDSITLKEVRWQIGDYTEGAMLMLYYFIESDPSIPSAVGDDENK